MLSEEKYVITNQRVAVATSSAELPGKELEAVLRLPEIASSSRSARSLPLPEQPEKGARPEELKKLPDDAKDLSPAHQAAVAAELKALLPKYQTTKALAPISGDFAVSFSQPGTYMTDAFLAMTWMKPAEIHFNGRDVMKCYRSLDPKLTEPEKVRTLAERLLPVYGHELTHAYQQREAAKAAKLTVMPPCLEDEVLSLVQECRIRKELIGAKVETSLGNAALDREKKALTDYYTREGTFGILVLASKMQPGSMRVLSDDPEKIAAKIAPSEKTIRGQLEKAAELQKRLSAETDQKTRGELEKQLESIPVKGYERTLAGLKYFEELLGDKAKYSAVQQYFKEAIKASRASD